MTIDITGLDKGEVLAALYNASKPQGLGFLHYDPKPMIAEEGQSLVEQYDYFDYLKGRVMKVRFDGNAVHVSLYDRDNGDGAAERAIENLRQSKVTR